MIIFLKFTGICLSEFEDKRFYSHNGVDLLAVLRAISLNISNKRVVSGASTLTMQVAKLLETRPRSLKSKVIEAFRAYQLEKKYSKKEILEIYATITPMGGNIEGIMSASWSFFNKPPKKLTIAEMAWLVALPQRPNKYNLRNRKSSEIAKNKVLKFSLEQKIITKSIYKQAIKEKIISKKTDKPFFAPHFTRNIYRENKSKKNPKSIIKTTISFEIQKKIEQILKNNLKHQTAHSTIAAAVYDNQKGKYLAWIGSADFFSKDKLGQNDMLLAIRSPGSVLKPFIYLFAFDDYKFLATTTVNDIKTNIGEYSVKNYSKKYHGKVTLGQALRLSINTTAVNLLKKIGARYYAERIQQQDIKFHLPLKENYTLPLALGGFGITAKDMINLYSKLANCSYFETQNLVKKDNKLASFDACWKIKKILQLSNDSNG